MRVPCFLFFLWIPKFMETPFCLRNVNFVACAINKPEFCHPNDHMLKCTSEVNCLMYSYDLMSKVREGICMWRRHCNSGTNNLIWYSEVKKMDSNLLQNPAIHAFFGGCGIIWMPITRILWGLTLTETPLTSFQNSMNLDITVIFSVPPSTYPTQHRVREHPVQPCKSCLKSMLMVPFCGVLG